MPRAILVGIQVPSVDDIAHAAGIVELSRLVKTLGYEVVGTMSQKRDELDGATVLGKGRLGELAAIPLDGPDGWRKHQASACITAFWPTRLPQRVIHVGPIRPTSSLKAREMIVDVDWQRASRG